MTTNTQTESKQSAALNKLYWIALGAALLIFAIGASLALGGKAMSWEASLFYAINGWSNSLDTFFNVITFLGSTWMALISVATAFAVKAYRLAYRLAITIVGAYGVAYVAKHLVDRARPEESLLAGVHTRVVESGMGFPSGHATISTVLALTLVPYLPKWAQYIGVPLFIGLVCLSRLYLGVHLPLDVIGGIAIGTGAVCLLQVLPHKLLAAVRLVRK